MAEATPAVPACPICGSERFMHKRLKKLYGHMVCRKCWVGFINRRQAAYVIDYVLFYIVTVFFSLMVAAVVAAQGLPELIISSLTIACSVLLYLMRDASSGRSLGKLLCGLQTLDRATGNPISVGASLKRNLPLAFPLVALLIAIQINRGPRLGDKWSNAAVVWNRHLESPVFRSLFQHLPEVAPAREIVLAAQARDVEISDNPYSPPVD